MRHSERHRPIDFQKFDLVQFFSARHYELCAWCAYVSVMDLQLLDQDLFDLLLPPAGVNLMIPDQSLELQI